MSLRIYLLGQFKLLAGTDTIELSSRPAQSVLAYLALNPGITYRREKLSSLIWPETSDRNARSYLRQALWRIRKSIESVSLEWQDYLQISDISVTFNDLSDYWLDAEALLKTTKTETIEQLIEIVNLYRGELLPGFYDEWVVIERDQLQAAHHQKMNLLLDRLVLDRQWDQVLKWGEHWIRLGYSPEPAYRALMHAHAVLGDLGMVSASYQRCLEALDRELGLKPSPETRQLYESILLGETIAAESPAIPVSVPSVKQPAFLDNSELQVAAKPLFVAREAELAKLDGYLEQSLANQGRVVFITGEAGSGKTALIEEFSRRIQDKYPDLVVASGNCNAQTGIGDPYLPFREILELLTGDVEARWAAGTITRKHAKRLWNIFPLSVQALLENGPDLVNTFISGSRLIQQFSVGSSFQEEWINRLDNLANQRESSLASISALQRNLFEQYTRVMLALSRHVPLLVLLDDLQWADQGSISLLFHMGRNLSGSRVMIIGAFRAEELALGRSGERHPLISLINELQRQFGDIVIDLDKSEHRDFVAAILDSEPNSLGKPFYRMLQRQTQGQPLFTIELLRGMQERGDLVRDQGGRWVKSPSLNWETIPARVEAVIAERIGRLPDPLHSMLRVASVEGDEFTAEVIAAVQAEDENVVLEHLNKDLERRHHLIRTHSIQRIDSQLLSRYRFRHILIQKFLYTSLNEVERVHLHEQVGSALEALFTLGETAGSETFIAPQLARHFTEAKIKDKAIQYLMLAGERALQLSAYQESFVHLNKGLELVKSLPDGSERLEAELALQFSLSIVLKGLKSNASPETERALIRARELCLQLDKKNELCTVLGELVIVYFVRAEYEKAQVFSEETLRLVQQVGDPILISLAHWQLGFVNFGWGNFITSRRHLGEVIKHYRPEEHHQQFVSLRGSDAGVSALAFEACCLWILGYPDQAHELGQETLALSQKLGHPFSRVDTLYFAGCMLNSLYQDADTIKACAEELEQLSEEKVTGWQGSGTIFIGEALSLQGQFKEAIECIERGLYIRKLTGVKCMLSGTLGTLALLHAKIGEVDAGLKVLSEALESVEETGERYWEAEFHRLHAVLLLMKGNETKAESSLVKAIEIARDQEAKSWELRAATDLAGLWRKQVKKEQAHQLLSEIYGWFTEGFDTPDLLAAKSLLDELL